MIRVPVASLLTAILVVVAQTPAAALCLPPMEASATQAIAVNHQYVWFLVESLAHGRIGWQEVDSAADSPNPAVRLANLKLAVEDFQCAASLVQRFQAGCGLSGALVVGNHQPPRSRADRLPQQQVGASCAAALALG